MINIPYKVRAGDCIVVTRRRSAPEGGICEPGVVLRIFQIVPEEGGDIRYSAYFGSGVIHFSAEEFEPYSDQDFWMVKGPGTTRVQHHTFEDADAEAKRLSELSPTQKYYILKTVGYRQVMSPEATYVPMGG